MFCTFICILTYREHPHFQLNYTEPELLLVFARLVSISSNLLFLQFRICSKGWHH